MALTQTQVIFNLGLVAGLLISTGVANGFAAEPARPAELDVLFLGDNGHHQPAVRFHELAPPLKKRGIVLHYTDSMADLNPKTLAEFDGLLLYANIDRIEDEQAEAVLGFVANGGGFIPLHCATYCWRNNEDMVALMGAQFQRHGTGTFSTQIAKADHPVMKGYSSFTSWDETYIHHRHNEKDRVVLEYRVEGDQAQGQMREPWTWVRTHGEGRVFYTAWGHDARTFTNPGFQNLVERGIRWACGRDPSVVPSFREPRTFTTPRMTELSPKLANFEYVDVGPKIPNYRPGEQWGAQGQPRNLMQLPLSAEDSIKHFVVPEGFAVRLYADERNFQAKPIAMTWDERGRLWVCETVDYPNELGQNRDRIRICEDTTGDGAADKFTVFADGLSIPTAIVIVRGGAVVQNGTETIYLKDTDGDDVADERTTLITGWALGDTHGGVSNFRYGLDNWIWAMQGYNNSTPTIDGKPQQTFRMGFWRFKLSQTDPPRVTDLEFVRSTDNNTWGLGISEEGLIFGSTANHNPSVFMPIPNRYYERVRGWAPPTLRTIADSHRFQPITENVRQVDHFGGYTAGAGHALYTARAFPEAWWNQTAFVCGPTGHLVGTFVLRPNGANFASTSPVNLLASDDEWSAPIMAEVGPDGAVWVIDWYNYIVQHNPTPRGFRTGRGNAYESELRDKKHGRVYRVVPNRGDAEALHEVVSLAEADNQTLVQALKHPSMAWRLQAQRLLVERNASEMVGELVKFITDPTVDEIGLNVGAIHALHTLAGLDLIGEAKVRVALEKALDHPSAGVRRNALAVLPADAQTVELLEKHRQVFSHADAQVQLQAFLRLADLPPAEFAGNLIARQAAAPTDTILRDALTAAAATHAMVYLNALGTNEPPPTEKANLNARASAANLAIARRVAEHLARGKPDASELQAVLAAIKQARPPVQAAVLDGLLVGLPADFRLKAHAEFDAALLATFKQLEPDTKVTLLRIATRCGTQVLDAEVDAILESLLAVVRDGQASDRERIAAARDLLGFRDNDLDLVQAIIEQLGPQASPELGAGLLAAVRTTGAKDAAALIVEAMPTFTPSLKSAAINTLLSRADWAGELLAGIEAGEVAASDLSLEQRQALQAFPNEAVSKRAQAILAMSGGLPNADREAVLQALIPLTQRQGDVAAGREMFKKHCAACHQHGEMGKALGPNLTGMSVHPKTELLTHIIDPSRSVEGNFRIYTVVTTEGRVLSGMLAAETRTTITLIDTQAKETTIPREEVEELVASQKSLMPEGFEKQMTEGELSDLLEFLTNKGKYVPVPLDRYATAVSTKGLFSEGDDGPDRMIFEDWGPKMLNDIPFVLTDPQGKQRANLILLNGPFGPLPPKMPKSVSVPCNTAAKAIHLLSGVGGWSYPYDRRKTVSMIVRLTYVDGASEDHELVNGVHFADYIRRVDVSGSEFAFALGGQQLRYLAVSPKRDETIEAITFVKGDDNTAPMVMAVTIER